MEMLWAVYRWFEEGVRDVRCWLTGHETELADRGMSYYNDYWCSKCWRDNPDEENTLPYHWYMFSEWLRDRLS